MKTGWLPAALLAALAASVVLIAHDALSATCGNGVVEAGEGCDVGADTECPGGCMLNCKCGVAPAPVTVAPIADTYIEKGTEATWDHGGSVSLDVDTNPVGISYLKFDLRALPAPITHATLSLRCTNSSPDGGTLYPVASSTWTEGTRTGIDVTSAGGSGLKWTDVDVNRDGAVTALDASPWVPDLARPLASLGAVTSGVRTLNVTGAFRAGPGLYTLALRNTSTDGATFTSRESSTVTARPVLRVTAGAIAAPRCGDGIRSAPEVCDGANDDKACPGQCRSDCTCPAGLPSSAPFPCLALSGPLITLTGTHPDEYRNYKIKTNTKIDARAATFMGSPENDYPVNLDGEPTGCFAGGKVQGTYDRNASWKQMHDVNNAGVRWENDNMVIDGVRVDNVTDGIRPVGNKFLVRQAWLTYIRDDCVEDDHVRGGIIEDSLFDGCYVGFSSRPSTNIINAGFSGTNETLIVRKSLMRLQPMPRPNGRDVAMGHGQWFKWDALGTKLELHDNIFMAEEWGNSPRTMGPPSKLTSCSNNTMVWLGTGPYPSPLPSCFKIVTDRKVWDTAVAAWKARHPHLRP